MICFRREEVLYLVPLVMTGLYMSLKEGPVPRALLPSVLFLEAGPCFEGLYSQSYPNLSLPVAHCLTVTTTQGARPSTSLGVFEHGVG